MNNFIEDNDFVSIWLAETGNPAIEQLAQLNTELAANAIKILNENTLSETELAKAVDINHDEIQRWLNGRHTFSMKTMKEISMALEVMINTEKVG